MNEPTQPVPDIPAAVEAGRARGRRMRTAIPQLAARAAAARAHAEAVLARVRAARLTITPSCLEATVRGTVQRASCLSRSDRSVVETHPPHAQEEKQV
jgi:hypothetical protein